ncbi:hypothetical protein Tco_0557958 [Tanacetum coccineum]
MMKKSAAAADDDDDEATSSGPLMNLTTPSRIFIESCSRVYDRTNILDNHEVYYIGEVSYEDMHPFDPSCEIANSSNCIFPRVKFSSHDPIVHHSGHDIMRRVKVNVSFFDMHVSNIAWDLKVSTSLVGKVTKYSTTGPFVGAPSPSLGPSLWGSSSSRMISMNITSPSSSLEQTNLVLEDWGTNPSDSSIEFRFCTCSVAMKANGPGCWHELELVFPGLSYTCSTSGSLTWDLSGCLRWIVMALIELWICVEH